MGNLNRASIKVCSGPGGLHPPQAFIKENNMAEVGKKVGAVLNTKYNKSIYTAVIGAGVAFLYGVLAEFGIEVSAGLQTQTLILAMALTAFLVGNKSK